METAQTVRVAVALFAATNVDDRFLRVALFADPRLPPDAIVIGQYLGIAALVAASLAVSPDCTACGAIAGPPSLLASLRTRAAGWARCSALPASRWPTAAGAMIRPRAPALVPLLFIALGLWVLAAAGSLARLARRGARLPQAAVATAL